LLGRQCGKQTYSVKADSWSSDQPAHPNEKEKSMTFTELHRIVNPDEAPDSWSKNERRRIMRLVDKQDKMDNILVAMDLNPKDWTRDQKNQMASKIGLRGEI
jgi:hypothetical protein